MQIRGIGIKMFINLKKGQLDDLKNLMKNVSETVHWANGHYEVIVNDTKNLEYIMRVKQAMVSLHIWFCLSCIKFKESSFGIVCDVKQSVPI